VPALHAAPSGDQVFRLSSFPSSAHRVLVVYRSEPLQLEQPVSPELIEHFRNPRNVGELPPPAVVVEVSNPVCGDILRLSATIERGRVREARYKVRGCTASIAAGSALTELLAGRGRAELKTLSKDDIDRAVGGLSNESKHAAALCVQAVEALLRSLPPG